MKKDKSIILIEVEDINDAISVYNDVRTLKEKYKIIKIDIMNSEHYHSICSKNIN